MCALGWEYLWGVEPKPGKPIPTFGEDGRADLKRALGDVGRAMIGWNSAPFVCKDVVMVGVSMNDNVHTRDEPPGLVQAFDVHTGRPRWQFNPIPPPREVGNETWENDSWAYTGSANVWSLFSADEDLGYAFLPTGSPTSDM